MGNGRFFRKSGNGRGIFPDQSVQELESLFTNDDEKDSSCPCAIEDNPQSPVQPPSCEPLNPVYQEVTIDDF
jgi:hypothetical protein